MGKYSNLTPKEVSAKQYRERIKEYVVYVITTPLGQYIGYTQNLELRMNQHRSSMRHQKSLNYKSNPELYHAMQEDYNIQVIFTGTKEQAKRKEIELIHEEQPFHNKKGKRND